MKIEISFDSVDEMLKFARELAERPAARSVGGGDQPSTSRIVLLEEIQAPDGLSPLMRGVTGETLKAPSVEWVGLNPEPEPGVYPGPGPRVWGQPAPRRPRDARLVAQTPVTPLSGMIATLPPIEDASATQTWLATANQDDSQIQSQTEEGA